MDAQKLLFSKSKFKFCKLEIIQYSKININENISQNHNVRALLNIYINECGLKFEVLKCHHKAFIVHILLLHTTNK